MRRTRLGDARREGRPEERTRRAPGLALALALSTSLSLGAGCQGSPSPSASSSAPGPAVSAAALSGRPLALGDREVLLDGDGERLFIGVLEPAPPNADPPLRMRARLVDEDGEAIPWEFRGLVIDRVRFTRGGGALMLSTRGDLWWVALPPKGGEEVIDSGVVGAVGASLDGETLVYTKGEEPDLEVYRLAPDARESKRVAEGFAPAWSPGVSPDGRVVYVVSGRTGYPAWWRLADGEEPVQLTNVGVKFVPGEPPPPLAPFAAGLGPTLVGERLVIFEGRGAVHVMTTDGRLVKTLADARAPFWERPGAVVGYLDTAAGAVRSLDLAELAP
ncbi:MAG: hypothetical protein KC635_19725 [Myxococcales bacterium]|nr:hypothetical protein [Myxococcales bacterium]